MKSVVLIFIFSAFSAQALEIAALPGAAPAAPMSTPQPPQTQVSKANKPKPAGQTQAKALEDCKDEVPQKPTLDETFCTVDELNAGTQKQ
jgi:hypothetical protein